MPENTGPKKKLSVWVVYHSKSGHTEKLAHAVAEHLGKLPLSVHATPCEDADPQELLSHDVIVLGSPTYFGNMSAELKGFVDRSISVYQQLKGRRGGVFTTAGSAGDLEKSLTCLSWALEIHGIEVLARAGVTDRVDDNARETAAHTFATDMRHKLGI
jgi:NAD(P)H dehydrogenase (quinone)